MPELGECVEWDCWKPAPYEYRDVAELPEVWYAQCPEHAAEVRAVDGARCIVRTYRGDPDA